MNIELDQRNIELIAQRVLELIKPLLKPSDEKMMDVQELSAYLNVRPQWIYQKVHLRKIPFHKVGKYPRFKRSEIDQWLNDSR